MTYHSPLMLALSGCLLCLGLAIPARAQRDVPTEAAHRVAEEIRREALLPPTGPGGRPLPLASHWNVGTVRGSFELDHQLRLLMQDHYIIPCVAWPEGDPGRS